MKKKITNEQVEQFIKKLAQDLRDEMDYDFRVAQGQMWLAENDLINSLDQNQLKLHQIYRERREDFYKIANELYQRKF